tara:strand:- start:4726 stop:5034 length:309 start_codon:yes stop_codon:yes gene_type:complete
MTAYPPSPCDDGGIKPRRLSTDIEESTIIAPNPSKGNVVIDLKDKLQGNYKIFNSQGEMVMTDNFDKRILNINFYRSLKNGNYFIRIAIGKTQFTKQIILNR